MSVIDQSLGRIELYLKLTSTIHQFVLLFVFTYPLMHLWRETCLIAVIVWHNMVTNGILLLDGSVLRNGSLKSHNLLCLILSSDISLLAMLQEEYSRSLAFTSLVGLSVLYAQARRSSREALKIDGVGSFLAQANMPVSEPNGPYLCKTRCGEVWYLTTVLNQEPNSHDLLGCQTSLFILYL
jgi:hypothetical protein